jgi:hypothetical protein
MIVGQIAKNAGVPLEERPRLLLGSKGCGLEVHSSNRILRGEGDG